MNYNPDMFDKGFNCNFIKHLNCNTEEEKWRAQYTTLKRRNSIKDNISKKQQMKYYKSMKDFIKA